MRDYKIESIDPSTPEGRLLALESTAFTAWMEGEAKLKTSGNARVEAMCSVYAFMLATLAETSEDPARFRFAMLDRMSKLLTFESERKAGA